MRRTNEHSPVSSHGSRPAPLHLAGPGSRLHLPAINLLNNSSRLCKGWLVSPVRAATGFPVEQQRQAAQHQQNGLSTEPGLQQLAPADTLQDYSRPETGSPGIQAAKRVLMALGNYAPMSLSDGPASLAKVFPYNAEEVQQALDNSSSLLPRLHLQQLSSIAAALAAAGHLDRGFMLLLGGEAAARLKAPVPVTEHKQGLAAFRSITWLAVGCARLGVLHVGLMQQIADKGAWLLRHSPMRFSKTMHGRQVALLAAAFAALKLYPPQLYRAIGDHLKQHKYVLRLMGPQESMLLLWAFARVNHVDAPAQLLITQRATTQVGQLDCQGLAHAYTQCASGRITAAPLLAALRKSTRQRLQSMQAGELSAVLTAVAVLGLQDALFLDEISRAVYNKLANFTAAEISASLAACGMLRYRNPWLLERVSKVLVSRKLRKAYFLTPEQLVDVLTGCLQLQWSNPLLISHLGSVAAEVQLPGCSPAQLAAVVQGYRLLNFQQPQMLQAAATRLLQLVLEQEQQQGQERLAQLISAAHSLAGMPPAGGTSTERAVLLTAAVGLARQALGLDQQQQSAAEHITQNSSCRCADLAKLLATSILCQAGASLQTGSSIASWMASVDPRFVSGVPGDAAAAPGKRPADLQLPSPHAGQQAVDVSLVQEQAPQLPHVLQQLAPMQQLVQLQLQQQLSGVTWSLVLSQGAAASSVQAFMPELAQAMQLLWLVEQVQAVVAAGLPSLAETNTHSSSPQSSICSMVNQQPKQHRELAWTLGLPVGLIDDCCQQQLRLSEQDKLQQQQQQQAPAGKPHLQRVGAALLQMLHRADGTPQLQLQVKIPFRLPNSPLLLPIALIPGAADGTPQSLPALSNMNQDRRQLQDDVELLHVQVSFRQKKLQLPPEVEATIAECQRSQTPVAVFIAEQLPLELEPSAVAQARAWFTSNAPKQPLPAASLLHQGLAAAGWTVVVLEEELEHDQDE